jgi:hypothetical protein
MPPTVEDTKETMMHLNETFMRDRRETATDQRGIPGSFQRALTALKGTCTHCTRQAVVSNGAGVALCAHHRASRPLGSIAERERLRQEIDIERRS